jgi:hypothetical protein
VGKGQGRTFFLKWIYKTNFSDEPVWFFEKLNWGKLVRGECILGSSREIIEKRKITQIVIQMARKKKQLKNLDAKLKESDTDE